MNIEDIFKPRGQSGLVNGTPPCQNIMFPNPFHFFPSSSSSSQHPYQYQPMIHVPKKTSTTTLGEVGASVDMLRAQVTELSKRMDAMEYSFSEFKNSVANDVFLLKSTISEHATELLHVRDCVEDAHVHAKKTKELIEQQDICIDEMADATSRTIHLCRKHLQLKKNVSFKSNVVNAQLGIIRRRVSKIEEFTNDFFEQFESFKSVKDIVTGLSDHLNECDRDISLIVTTKYNNSSGSDKDNEGSLNDYFSKYDETDDDVNKVNKNNTEINDDDFEKIF